MIRLTKPAIGGVTGVLATLMLLATLTGSAAQSPPAAQPATGASAPSSVSVGGVTLRSVSVVLPESQRTFAGGGTAEAINKECLICHSASMVLTQPEMSLTQWKAEEEKMRSAYDAPIDPKDDDVIADYLAKLRLTNAAAAYQQVKSHQPDPEHGRVIAAQGTAGVPPCAGCHALNGASDGSGAFPRIAGQSAYYLAKQMHAFTSDLRTNAIMSPLAKALSAKDIVDVAAYYASLDPPFPPLPSPAPALVLDGEQLATTGNTAKGISACENCHGPRGTGDPPAIPYLAGQYAQYIALELQMWRRGYRKNSADIMLIIAGKLDDHDAESLAAYYQQLRTVTPVNASK
jgi:cytochrome c553